MPEKVTSLNGLKVTLEYCSYTFCQSSLELSIRWLVRNVYLLKSLLRDESSIKKNGTNANLGIDLRFCEKREDRQPV